MVQERDAAKKRKERRDSWLKKEKEKYQKSVIKTAWVVVETTPGYNTGGYYDQDVPEENVVVSSEFETRDDAAEWMDKHEADNGKYLRIAHKDLRRIEYTQWTGLFFELRN